MSHSSDLGTERTIDLSAGTLHYRETGEGPCLLFLHGLLANGDLWRKVVPRLAPNFRCITPDWPLGAHATPMKPDADLSIPALAGLVSEFIQEMALERPTLIANDTGGAIAQCVMTQHGESLRAAVLTPCDAFDNFLPAMFRPLQLMAYLPPVLTALLQPFRFVPVLRSPLAFGWLAKHPVEGRLLRSYVEPILSNRAIRQDTYKILRAIHPSVTQEAAARLGEFQKPAMILWAKEDRFFPADHGRRLAALLPDSRLETIDDAYTFVSEDQPAAVAHWVETFLKEATSSATC